MWDFQRTTGRISLTADGWSDQRRRPWFGITGHWIHEMVSGALENRAALLAFHPTGSNGDGKSLARLAHGLVERAGIVGKVFTLLALCFLLTD